MKNRFFIFLLLAFIALCCTPESKEKQSHHLGMMTAFAEMVAADLKPLALSEPMDKAVADDLWPMARELAQQYGVDIYRENDLLSSKLFPSDVASNKTVFIFYKSPALSQYQALKDAEDDSITIARNFGELLGYPVHKINGLLSAQTDFRTTSDFGIQATNAFLYYKNLDQAVAFYTVTLGLPLIADYGFAKTIQIAPDAYIILVDEKVGMHSSQEPKSIAIALLTDDLESWFNYLQKQNVTIEYPYRKRENNAHDGFVALDPEGYYLEFEIFKPHAENKHLIPLLQKHKVLKTDSPMEGLPKNAFYGAITWLYYDDMLAAQSFYEQQIGLRQVVDQGWAKVYSASETGFIGLVDACRGMRDNTPDKGATASFFIKDVEGYFDYVQQFKPFPLRQDSLEIDPQGRYRAFVGFDPAGYFLEFDQFYDHESNKKLLESLY